MDELRQYRQHLVLASQKSQEDYDKTIIALSGGGLGITMVFLDKFLALGQVRMPTLIVVSWMCWGASLLATLFSFYTSNHALRLAILKVDEGAIYDGKAGGWLGVLTGVLNGLSGVLFVAGVLLVSVFVLLNIASLS